MIFLAADSDYRSVTEEITFPSLSSDGTIMTVNVAIIGDKIVEMDETFTVVLTAQTSDMNNTFTITIIDDDCKLRIATTIKHNF